MRKELKHWKTDVPSGLIVFLVAIPLCLGIALASGAPALSGVIAGIVGGLVVTLFSNSALGVSGPAAGLVAIVLPAIQYLGFQNFLLAVVLGGVIQFLLGCFKAGTIGYYFPTAVIKGMLVAIGLIIILKQIPHAFGYDKDYEGDLAFVQSDGYNTFSELTHAMQASKPAAIIISIVCLGILILWETRLIKQFPFSKIIQGPLVAVLAGILLGLGFSSVDSMRLSTDHLVSLPDGTPTARIEVVVTGDEQKADSQADAAALQTSKATPLSGDVFAVNVEQIDSPNASIVEGPANGQVALNKDGTFTYTPNDDFTGKDSFLYQYEKAVSLTFPHFKPSEINAEETSVSADGSKTAGMTSFQAIVAIFITALTLAIVASLESLLCAEATDKLDPQRRQTDLNRELRAQGIGNFVSGLIGGLPVTQVIVRSSTNIQSGAQSRLAAFVHGLFLIVCVVTIPSVLNLIPLASLAAILFIVGYKLAHPSKFIAMYKLGWHQFLPFMITISAILFTDLLRGIGIGLVASIFFILRSNYVKSFWMSAMEEDGVTVHRMTLAESVFFLNKGDIQAALLKIQPGSKLVIDGSDSVHIDQDVIDLFNDFETNAEFQNIEVQRIDFQKEAKSNDDPARVKRLADVG
ncbi:MAG: SulP family inorganic anion transporter [Planctomycetota bacterium]|nr:SulP family inorganic anion transporter [Planctomycetota bacterium]